jgi:hypothetical protein
MTEEVLPVQEVTSNKPQTLLAALHSPHKSSPASFRAYFFPYVLMLTLRFNTEKYKEAICR